MTKEIRSILEQKLQKFNRSVAKLVPFHTERHINPQYGSSRQNKDGEEIIQRLKSKFEVDTTSRSEKLQVLTVLPQNWTRPKVSK